MTSRYRRPRVGWIKRRARRLMSAFAVSRRDAVASAAEDFRAFVRGNAHPWSRA